MLSNLLKGLFNRKIFKKIDLTKLPSQGIFYSDGFDISIKKATIEDISYYKDNYQDDPLSIIGLIKEIVKTNSVVSDGFSFDDISSIDIVYIFFEIVSLTKGDDIWINYVGRSILFNSDHFNYFELDDDLMDKYDPTSKEFNIEGFKFRLPSIGIESSVTDFIKESAINGSLGKFSDKSYDFMYFLGNRNSLDYNEVENLITIFNDELGNSEKDIVTKIINDFSSFSRYSLKSDDGEILEMGDLDLSRIWD